MIDLVGGEFVISGASFLNLILSTANHFDVPKKLILSTANHADVPENKPAAQDAGADPS